VKLKKRCIRLQVESTDTHDRLDLFLAQRCPEISRSDYKKIIDIGGVQLNGRRVRKCSQPVCAGNKVDLYLDGRSLEIWQLTVDSILYEDDYLLVINKPAGIDFQPTPSRFKGTLYAAALVYLRQNPVFRRRETLGMVQRLDRDTSGVCVFSIHPRAHKSMTQQVANHHMGKKYLAVVAGFPRQKRGEIESLLARSRRDNRMKSVAKGGKRAVTAYEVISEGEESSLLQLQLMTGRMHQIRVHMSESGHPLLGDTLYGGGRMHGTLKIDRQMLHACELSFEHPVSRQKMLFSAPLPTDFIQVLHHVGCSLDSIDSGDRV